MKKYPAVFFLLLFVAPSMAVTDGKTDYNADCAGCHGAHGNVRSEKAGASETDAGKRTLKGTKKNKAEMTEIIEKGKGKMPGFKKELSKEQIAAIVLYIMSLHRYPGR